MNVPPKEQRPHNVRLLLEFISYNKTELEDVITALEIKIEQQGYVLEDFTYMLEEARKLLRTKFSS